MPARPIIFSWSVGNVEHLAKHDVEPLEAAEVLLNAGRPYPMVGGRDRFVVWGRTRVGRYLQVVYTYLSDQDIDVRTLSPNDLDAFTLGKVRVAYVIHARDLTENERRRYRRTLSQDR